MFTKPFQQLSKHDANIAGGKGASLGEMITSGIPVPDGFVVLSTTFDKFLEITDISIEIDAILNKVNHNEVHTVENASKQIQALILSAKMPKDIAKEIKTEFSKLNCKYVAVRSSATAEDSASAAWAGQLDSFLNTTEETLLENVQRCFASLFTPRAIFYRFEKELHNQTISVAVVVQKMVNSKVSGIAFSVHPVTEDRNQIIIEAGFGLGEAIVSGQTTPDSYVVTKDDLNILDKNIYTQERGIFRDDKKGGNEWKNIPEATAKEQCLSDKQIIELSSLIIKIENHYNFPCDIEWAMEDDKLYIVQSRPITTLKEIKNKTAVNWTKLVTRKNSIFMDFIKIYGSSRTSKDFGWDYVIKNFKIINGSNYYKEDYFDSINLLREHYSVNKDIFGDILKNFYKDIDTFKNVWCAIEKNDFEKLSKKELEELFVKYSESIVGLMTYLLIPLFAEKIITEELEKIIDKKFANDNRDEILSLLSSPKKRSSVQDEQIDFLKMLNDIKKSPQGREALINTHLSKWSWLGDHNFFGDFWTVDDINKRIELEKGVKNVDKKIKEIIKTEKDQDLLCQQKIKNSDLTRNDFEIIDLAREFVYLRTYRLDMLFYSELKVVDLFKDISRRMGISFADFFMLTHLEIIDWFSGGREDFSLEIEKRKKNYAIILDNSVLNIFSGNEVEPFEEKEVDFTDKQEEIIKGNTAFSGKVIGTVKIILSKDDFNSFKENNILVTAMTTPDYVPLMKKASAIITDEGGITCHAAIVSRELGIPCIIGTKIATQVLEDGDEVEVDADNGVVRILQRADNKFDLNYSDYQKLFQLESIFYFVNDILMSNYKKLQAVFLYRDGKWNSYLPKNVIQKTMREGLNLFKDNLKFNNYQKSFSSYKKESGPFFKKIIKNKKIHQKELQQFFKYTTDIHRYYIKTEFFYTDLAFIKSADNKIISKNLETLGEFKNTSRLYLNFIFFECIGRVMEILSKQFKIRSEDLLCYSQSELLELFKEKRVPQEIIDKRRIAYLTIGSRNSYITHSGQEANEIIDKFLPVIDGDQNVLMGLCANSGKVSGRARVITYGYGNFDQVPSFVKEMKAGEILVADTTSPELILACKKAKAILTNQGGLMSHAAIVSREFKIPCIVSLKNATEIIKTGDEVEVDADNGAVRILNKNKSKDLSEEILSTEWFHLGKWIEPALAAEVWLEYGLTAQQFFKSKLDNKILYLNGDFFLSKHDSDIFQNEGYEAAKNHNKDFFENIYKKIKEITEEISIKVHHVESVVDFLEDYKKLTGVWMPLNNIAIGIEKFVQENDPKVFELAKGFLDEKPLTIQQIDEMNNLKDKIEKFLNKKIEKPQDIPEKYKKEINKHLKKYEWLGTHHFSINKLTPDNLISRMKQSKADIKKTNEKKINKKEEYLLWLLDIIGFVRFKAAETSGYTTYYFKNNLISIAKEKGLTYEDIVEHTIEEISLKNISKDLAEERRRNTGFYYDGNKKVLSAEQINSCLAILLKKGDENRTEFTGLSAQTGKAKGVVKIVIKQDQMNGFKEGMILVAHETTPDIVFAMQKSSAIVTDFGGLTSHAAIIARELKKPCIVGTQIATQVLQDGDEVEVDADNGIVKIIKRKK